MASAAPNEKTPKLAQSVTLSAMLSPRRGRALLRHTLHKPWLQGVMVGVILLDVICLIVWDVLAANGRENTSLALFTWYFGAVTLAVFIIESVLRLIAAGPRNFIRDIWNLLDAVIISASTILFVGQVPGDEIVIARVFKMLKWLRWLRVLRMCTRCGPVVKVFKRLVSKSKMRYIDEEANFDLDLSYIVSQDLIAMGVPVESFFVGMYRNPIRQVARFFEVYHLRDFRIYNLCPELPYSDDAFVALGGEVVRFQVQDHTPPTMAQFIQFLTDAARWKSQADHSKGVLAVHCKAGKGRTGSLCCAWLLYSGKRKSVREALDLFAERRTDIDLQSKEKKRSGVETPSQVRYIQQVWQHLVDTDSWFSSPASPVPPCPAPGIALDFLGFEDGLFAKPEKMKPLKVLIQCGGATGSAAVLETAAVGPESAGVQLSGIKVSGDVRISVFQEKTPDFSAEKAMANASNAWSAKGLVLLCAFHTNFMRQPAENQDPPDLEGGALRIFRIPVEELDKASKKVKKGKHRPGSSLAIKYYALGKTFEDAAQPSRSGKEFTL